jgi:hypothetical protein
VLVDFLAESALFLELDYFLVDLLTLVLFKSLSLVLSPLLDRSSLPMFKHEIGAVPIQVALDIFHRASWQRLLKLIHQLDIFSELIVLKRRDAVAFQLLPGFDKDAVIDSVPRSTVTVLANEILKFLDSLLPIVQYFLFSRQPPVRLHLFLFHNLFVALDFLNHFLLKREIFRELNLCSTSNQINFAIERGFLLSQRFVLLASKLLERNHHIVRVFELLLKFRCNTG